MSSPFRVFDELQRANRERFNNAKEIEPTPEEIQQKKKEKRKETFENFLYLLIPISLIVFGILIYNFEILQTIVVWSVIIAALVFLFLIVYIETPYKLLSIILTLFLVIIIIGFLVVLGYLFSCCEPNININDAHRPAVF